MKRFFIVGPWASDIGSNKLATDMDDFFLDLLLAGFLCGRRGGLVTQQCDFM
jgi:hypothetical protein